MRTAPEVEATNAAAVVVVGPPADDDHIILKEIEVSYSAAPTGGLLTVTDGRTDAGCTVSSTSPTVLDAAIEAEDNGLAVTGTGVPAGAVVGNVVPGVSFQFMVAGVATNGTATGSETLTFGQVTDFKVDVTAAGATNIPLPEEGLRGTASRAVTVTLSAGGAGIVGRVNVGYDEGPASAV